MDYIKCLFKLSRIMSLKICQEIGVFRISETKYLVYFPSSGFPSTHTVIRIIIRIQLRVRITEITGAKQSKKLYYRHIFFCLIRLLPASSVDSNNGVVHRNHDILFRSVSANVSVLRGKEPCKAYCSFFNDIRHFVFCHTDVQKRRRFNDAAIMIRFTTGEQNRNAVTKKRKSTHCV